MLTAYQIQQNMKPICEQLLVKYSVDVNIDIEIHTGNVVIGNIGSYLRMDYTDIRDSVNIASRVKSGTAAGQIMVSMEVDKATSNSFEYGGGVEKMLKGKSQTIAIYELFKLK